MDDVRRVLLCFLSRSLTRGRSFAALLGMIRSGVERDAQDICFAVTNYWARVDFNRVPENDMVQFVLRYPSVAQAWEAIRRKYNA